MAIRASSAGLIQLRSRRRRLAISALVLALALSLVIAAPRLQSASIAAPIAVELPVTPADAWANRGRILNREVYDPPLGPGAALGQAWRAVYSSVSGIDGSATEVSGAFFIPRGTPPVGGWPVVALAHGTTGIGHNCGPSRQPDLQGYAPAVESLLLGNYAVALTDYEGLGESGSHLYLEQRSAAFNTVDAVRALANLSPSVSTRWIGVGYSQGGQAVWAANELQSFYGDGLQLQGTVAVAPAANVTATADLVWSQSLTEKQLELYPLLIVSFARFNAEIDERAFLHDETESYRNQLSYCEIKGDASAVAPPGRTLWALILDRIKGRPSSKPDSSDQVHALRTAMQKVALPQKPLERPMLVIAGADDQIIKPDWIRSAVESSCSLGGLIQYLELPGSDHAGVLWDGAPYVAPWIAERFAGSPAPSNCSSPG